MKVDDRDTFLYKKEGKIMQKQIKLPTVKELLEAGVHFGHETKRWNPEFRDYIFGKRGNFHIINLEKTLECLDKALRFLVEISAKGEILMIGTKRQARYIVKDEAVRCGAHFIVNRWIGGLITNFDEVQKSIKKLRDIENILSGDLGNYTQQQLSVLRRKWARLERLYGGVKTMEQIPIAAFVIDANYERIPVKELSGAGIPIVALVDSNTNPELVDYPIPANDDAIKSINLFVMYVADAILAGNMGKGVKHEFKDLSNVGIEKQSNLQSKNKNVTEKKKEIDDASKGETQIAKKAETKKKKIIVKPTKKLKKENKKEVKSVKKST